MLPPVDDLAYQIGATPTQLLGVVIATVGIYVVFLILVRIFGPRSLHGLSTFDAILAIMFGAVAGRVILGNSPTLAGGIVGLVTLFIMEAIFGQLRRTIRGSGLVNTKPRVVMVGEHRVTAAMNRAHLTNSELNSALRSAGVHSATEIVCVIVEPTGTLSVLKRGEKIDRELLAGVVGIEQVPGDLFNGDAS